MAAALVANYREMFAGAAFVARMPVGSARDAMSAPGDEQQGDDDAVGLGRKSDRSSPPAPGLPAH